METVVVVGSYQGHKSFVFRLSSYDRDRYRFHHLRTDNDFMGYVRGTIIVFLDNWQYNYEPAISRNLLESCRVRQMIVLSEGEFLKRNLPELAASTPKLNNLLLLL